MAIWVQLMTVFKQVSQMFSIFKVVPPKLTALAQAVSNLYVFFYRQASQSGLIFDSTFLVKKLLP